MEGQLKKYDNCISLGWFCGTASSMNRYGLRGHSGPFDWYFSKLESVLKVMETDFQDFMKKENLLIDSKDYRVFHDIKYGFCFNHEVKNDFKTEYSAIYQKYMRRAEYFMASVQQPTCFIRTVRSEEEIKFIEENKDYIYKVIKRSNSNNEIIFLILRYMKDLPNSYIWFRLNIEEYVGRTYEMRHMFDSSEDFSEYCKNILSDKNIKRNLNYDRICSNEPEFIRRLREANLDIDSIFKEFYPDIDEKGVFQWGAGIYGTEILKHLLKNGINVNAIIDNNTIKIGTFCEGIPVISFAEINRDKQNIFIAIHSEQVVDDVKRQIFRKHPNTLIYTLADLLRHSKVVKILIDY